MNLTAIAMRSKCGIQFFLLEIKIVMMSGRQSKLQLEHNKKTKRADEKWKKENNKPSEMKTKVINLEFLCLRAA